MALWAMKLATARPVVSTLAVLGSPHGVRQGPAEPKIALTFDDGPHPEYTPAVLDVLDREGAKATFFVVGRFVDEHPEIVKEARRRGHEIGTHLHSHERDTVDDEERFAAEVERCKATLEDLLGEPLRWLRFPYGRAGRQRRDDVERRWGVRVAHWTASSHDSKEPDSAAIVRRATEALRPGAILLFHDRLSDGDEVKPPYVPKRDASIAALGEVIRTAKARGLSAVTMSELLWDGGPSGGG